MRGEKERRRRRRRDGRAVSTREEEVKRRSEEKGGKLIPIAELSDLYTHLPTLVAVKVAGMDDLELVHNVVPLDRKTGEWEWDITHQNHKLWNEITVPALLAKLL